jgi:hypothetical protein
MTHKPYEVTLWVTPRSNIYLGSKVISGLCELARDGFLILRTTKRPSPVEPDDCSMCLEIHSPAGEMKRIFIDLLDHGDHFYPNGFTFADVYFKRSYHPLDIAKLQPEAQAKIVPFGLNFPCVSRSKRGIFLSIVWKKFTSHLFRSPFKHLGTLAKDLNFLRKIPSAAAFEYDCSSPRDATVLFQTRVWPPEESTEDLLKINNERVALVRSLREAFRDRFVGGVVADVFARQFCPDVLAETNLRRNQYAQLVRKATIGVYSRGLHQSLAYKLSEYLAAGMCIVSEPLLFHLPVPLEANVHYLPFTNHAECVAACRRLLENPDEAARMHQANIRYYRDHVEPQAHVRQMLARTFACQNEPATT